MLRSEGVLGGEQQVAGPRVWWLEESGKGLQTTEGCRYQRWYPGTNQKPQVLANSEGDTILKLPWLRWSLSSAPCLKSHFVFETKLKMILHISKGSIWLQLSGQQRLRST